MTESMLSVLGFGMPGLGEWVVIGIFLLLMGVPLFIILSISFSQKKAEKEIVLNSYKFASFWKRLFARLIDGLIIYIITLIIVFLLFQLSKDSSVLQSSGILGLILFSWLYQPILESKGGTFGKRLLGLKTIDLSTGLSPTVGKSYLRSVFYFFLTLLLIIPAIISGLAVLWSKQNQTWHDRATNVAVIIDMAKSETKTTSNSGHKSILKHADKLRELKSLQEQGIISSDEFETEKRKILDSEN